MAPEAQMNTDTLDVCECDVDVQAGRLQAQGMLQRISTPVHSLDEFPSAYPDAPTRTHLATLTEYITPHCCDL